MQVIAKQGKDALMRHVRKPCDIDKDLPIQIGNVVNTSESSDKSACPCQNLDVTEGEDALYVWVSYIEDAWSDYRTDLRL